MTGGPVYLIFILCCNSSLKDPGGSWMSYKTHLHANYSLRGNFHFYGGTLSPGEQSVGSKFWLQAFDEGVRIFIRLSWFCSQRRCHSEDGMVVLYLIAKLHASDDLLSRLITHRTGRKFSSRNCTT